MMHNANNIEYLFQLLSNGNQCNLNISDEVANSARGYRGETMLHAAVTGGNDKNVKKTSEKN